MNDRSSNGTGSFEVKIRTNTAKFTNMIIARFRESRYLVRKGEVFNKVTLRRARFSSGMCDHIGDQLLVREIYLSPTFHPGQLSLAIPPWVGTMSTGEREMTLCGWE